MPYIRMSSKYIYFDISPQSISKAVKLYQDFFFEMGDRIYSYKEINADYFNSRFTNEIAMALENAALRYNENINANTKELSRI